MKLAGKRAVVTGASQGLGLSIANTLAREGADVLICARSKNDLSQAEEQIRKEAKGRLFAAIADVAKESEVVGLASQAERDLGGTDVLVCNAGIYGPKGALDELDWESWVQAININLIGTVLCCRVFLPLLRKSARGKIILLSGGGATKPLPFVSAYAASKAAVVRFGETLAEELRPDGIDVNSVAPGAMNTRMLQEIVDAGPEKVGKAFYEASLRQQASGGTSPEVGAQLCCYLASDQSDHLTGKLISAVWDPWEQFAQHADDLKTTDIYTLRRIVPSDRKLDWGG